ncbi:hypothetical protein L2E82_06109 [Cichorium intybus]|uniref:Uncharacterized protein n=1 Tax=Cichorium intybus TaxID=13427 RepID=A0ACB9HAC7_CICIN|nr:hypothetical protein L2E82_06109 [Cichorium intybus]
MEKDRMEKEVDNKKLHLLLIEQGGVRALLGMVRSANNDVIAQVARGLTNLAKCETRAITEGQKKGRSLLMDDGVLSWLLANSNTTSISTRRHIELSLCHLAQNGPCFYISCQAGTEHNNNMALAAD